MTGCLNSEGVSFIRNQHLHSFVKRSALNPGIWGVSPHRLRTLPPPCPFTVLQMPGRLASGEPDTPGRGCPSTPWMPADVLASTPGNDPINCVKESLALTHCWS